MQLYKLTENYQRLLNFIESETYDPDTLIDTLEAIDESFDDKVTNTAYVIKNLTAEQEMLKNEIAHLTKRKQTVTNSIDRLKGNLLDSMQAVGKDKVKGDLFTVSVRNNAESVKILDETKLPADAFKVTYTPDKTAIKEILKKGRDVPGAALTRSQSLQIR